jgi:5-hydroxyisourate hydrolase-like protein (transthyretin family)
MKNDRGKTARVLAAAVISICAFAWAPAALAAAKTQGVAGTIVDGTTGKPVADLEVTLHLFSDTAELGSLKATTDADGAFSFPDLATDARGYQVTAVYKDVLYRNQMAALTPGTPIDVTLKVYEISTDPANVVQSSWIVWVDQGGSQNCTSGACVQHDIQWTNSGDTAFTGSPSPSGGAPIATQVPLAAGATNFQFLGTYLDTPGQVQGSTYVNPQPVVPGTSGATVRYDVKDLTQLKIPITLPTASFELYVPTGVDVKADRLTAAGEFTDAGITYQKFTASNLQAGDAIDVSLSGVARGKSSSPILLGIVGGLIVVVAGGLALWKLAGRGQKPGRGGAARNAVSRRPAPKQKGRQQTPAKSNGRRDRTPVRASASREGATRDEGDAPDDDFDEAKAEERFDLLIDEIAALDLAHEKGLLEQRTYEALRADAKERLLRLRTTETGERSSR